MSKTRTFLKESLREFKRVNWPTRRETMRYTLFVIGFSVGVALFLGFLDFVFSRVIERLV
ncbi:MAG TPA: preprotein translocase subunit SecE [Candidatus Jorgensenbacteria bacterium]|uniref:Protein translocase subunit SecE n=1 Tax=marine sediment metagenome TaxID=412755 RepID=A0A0F8XY98_9ZZZZ|nr:preprotein translocase subunit SecE [Candidatus Jorgensenbacteria bacterium]